MRQVLFTEGRHRAALFHFSARKSLQNGWISQACTNGAHAYLHLCRITTDDGQTLEDDLLEDMALAGVVTHQVIAIHEQDDSPI